VRVDTPKGIIPPVEDGAQQPIAEYHFTVSSKRGEIDELISLRMRFNLFYSRRWQSAVSPLVGRT